MLITKYTKRLLLPRAVTYDNLHLVCVNTRRLSLDTNYVSKYLTTNEVSLPLRDNNMVLFESNHLAANIPTEDRRFFGNVHTVVGDDDGITCFGVVDGHAGHKCAQAVNERLLSYIAVAMSSDPAYVADDVRRMYTRVKLPGDYNEAIIHQDRHFMNLLKWAEQKKPIERFTMNHLNEETFKIAYETLDRHLLENAIATVSRSMDRFDVDVIESALTGCCALTVALDNQDIICANTGDCRAVLGRLTHDGESYEAVNLTHEHNADNEDEVNRILEQHPGEDRNVILQYGRLFGSLLPLRAFGDMLFKVDRGQLEKFKRVFSIGSFESKSLTPPYLTAAPEVTRKKFEPGKDKFIILATDGLWDFIDSQTAVDVIGHNLSTIKSQNGISAEGNSQAQSTLDDHHSAVHELCTNGATRLICHAIGQPSTSTSLPMFTQLEEMIRLAPEETRQNRDDMQVLVVYFE